MARFLQSVTEYLESSNGLDMPQGFTPTVFEDPSFDSATVAVLRTHFRKWATTTPLQEQGVRYFRVCLELEPDSITQTGFVRLFYGEWEPDVNEDSKESVDLDEELGPLEGCTQEDVGWMRVSYVRCRGLEGSLVFAFNHLNRIGGCMQTSLSEHQQARTGSGSGSRYVHETLTTTLTHRKTRDSPNTSLRPDGR
ncbi:unnamed protein product [Penicillium discolor]